MIFSGKEILEKFFFELNDNDLFNYFITTQDDEDILDIKNNFIPVIEKIYKRKFHNMKLNYLYLYPKNIINNYLNNDNYKIFQYYDKNECNFIFEGMVTGTQKSLWLEPGISYNRLKNMIPQHIINEKSLDSLYYFEISIGKKLRDNWKNNYCGIGYYFINPKYNFSLDNMQAIGWYNSIGYHSDDGCIYNNSSNSGIKFDLFFESDTVGAGIYIINNKVKFFFYNHPSKFLILPDQEFDNTTIFYPTFDIDLPNIIKVNYGQDEFKLNKIPNFDNLINKKPSDHLNILKNNMVIFDS